MSLLFRGMSSKKGKNNESTVKKSLIKQLSAAVKDLQIDQTDEYLLDTEFKEATNALCTVLEAMFLHGLKDSFLRRVTLAVRSDIDDRPEPDFWAPLLVVSHRNVIDQISKLSLVTTDIGRSRAWIRLALNDGLMSRYLETIRREGQRALCQYYRPGALLRDTEVLDVAQRLIEGIEAVPLNLPLNSSLFDTWTQQPLLLAGLWTPPLRATALKQSVITGVEVGEVLDRDDKDQSDTRSMKSVSSFLGMNYEQMSVIEEDALKIILGTPVYETPIAARERAEQNFKGSREIPNESRVQPENTGTSPQAVSSQEVTKTQDNATPDPPNEENEDSGRGNSLSGRLGWSSSYEESSAESGDKKTEGTPDGKDLPRRQPGRKLQSFSSLLDSYYDGTEGSSVPSPDLADLLQQFETPRPNSSVDPEISRQADFSYPHDLGFEVIDGLATILENPEYEFLLKCMIKLPLEKGLDNQKYECSGCSHSVGLNFLPAKVCGLSGQYYCKDCTALPGEEWVIPSRILHNWDFRRVSVSKQASRFLEDIQYHPLFDIKTLNPRLYGTVRELDQLQTLRTQLNLLCAYLATCRENMMKELQKMVWPRDYLYEHVHWYSLADLLEIPTGSLSQLLKKVIDFARGHVLACWLCSQKGFFCEVCYKSSKDHKIIYPFDTNSTYRCPGCSAVYHLSCLDSTKQCPKCDRLRRRENESNTDEVCAF